MHIARSAKALLSDQPVLPNGTSLSQERAREKYSADTHRLLVSIFSVNHLYEPRALSSTTAGNLVPRPYPRGWSLGHGTIT